MRAACFAALLACNTAALAQDEKPADGGRDQTRQGEIAPATPPERTAHARFGFDAGYIFSADFDDAPGASSVGRAGARVDLSFPILKRSELAFNVSNELSWYGFDDDTVVGGIAGAPWDDIRITTIGARVSTRLDEHWGLYASANATSSGEEGAQFSDTLTYAAAGGFTYAFSDRLTLGLGVVSRTRLEDDPLILPLPTIDWRIAKQWALRTAYEEGGAGVELAWDPGEQFSLGIAAAFEGREFRLGDRSANPRRNFIGRDVRIPVWLWAQWNVSRRFSVRGKLGFEASQQLSLDNADGDELGSNEMKASPFFDLGVIFRF